MSTIRSHTNSSLPSKTKSEVEGRPLSQAIGDGKSLKNRMEFTAARDMSDENIKKIVQLQVPDSNKENRKNNSSKKLKRQE